MSEEKSPLEELRARQTALQTEIEKLGEERDRLEEERDSLQDEFVARAEHKDESKRPSDEEIADFRDAHRGRKSAIRAKRDMLAEKRDALEEVDERIEEVAQLTRSRKIAERASSGLKDVQVTHVPHTYRQDNSNQCSYFLDLAAAQHMEFRSSPNPRLNGFQERLDAHAKEMEVEMPKRWESKRRAAESKIDKAEAEFRSSIGYGGLRGLEVSPFERQAVLRADSMRADLEQRAPSRIVGQGGYAVPPLWLIDEYIPALRPGRVAAGLCRQIPLPEGTDSINIPRLLTPTLTGIQTGDAAPVASRDFSDTFQQANVKTIAGQEDVPIQLIEQSPGQILDRVLMTDLIADYNKQVDLQVITGSGVGAPLSGGQVVGMYPASNWGATSLTGTTLGLDTTSSTNVPYVTQQSEFFQMLGAMASKTAYNRFNLVNFHYLMHPRRHFWSVTGLDALGRPLGSDDGFGPYNSTEIEINPAPYEGYAGRTPFGPNIYIDGNVPITDSGAGTPAGGTTDFVIGAIWDDLWLFEGDLRTRVLTEVLSGTLELRFQVYAYVAFLQRYGVSVTLGFNTQFTAPVTASGATGFAF